MTNLRAVRTFAVWCPECNEYWQSENYINGNEVCEPCLFKPKPKRKRVKRATK